MVRRKFHPFGYFCRVSDHSRRTRRVLDRALGRHGVKVIVRYTHWSEFDPDTWWQDRDGQRVQIEESRSSSWIFCDTRFSVGASAGAANRTVTYNENSKKLQPGQLFALWRVKLISWRMAVGEFRFLSRCGVRIRVFHPP